jgi:hypothetical protein
MITFNIMIAKDMHIIRNRVARSRLNVRAKHAPHFLDFFGFTIKFFQYRIHPRLMLIDFIMISKNMAVGDNAVCVFFIT